MSTEEQDQIHGRLLRERGVARRAVAAASAKIKDASAALARAASALDVVARPEHTEPPDAARSAVEGLPEKPALLAAIQELIDERRKLRDIEMQLERFGRD